MKRDAERHARDARHERRRAPRVSGQSLPSTLHARLRAGHEVHILDFSRFGTLFESSSRLLPGHRCTLRLNGPSGHTAAAGRILRAEVARLDQKVGVIYRGAVEFEDAKTLKWVDDSRHG
jgi:hypothetical protein